MEVIAGVSSILQIIDSVTRVAKRLNEVRESYNNVALNTTLVASQLSTIRAALEALYEWRASDRDSTGPSRQLDKDLGMSLSCCAILISVIDGKLEDFGYMPGLKQKIKYLWLEDILKDYISNLEGQIRALQLLLTIFQCRTETEKRQKLGNLESRTIIEQVRAETASLALDNIDFQDAASVLSLNPSVTLDIDSILMKSPAYRRVYGSARLHLPPAASASLIENSEQPKRPAPTPFPNETLQPPCLPSRPMPKPVPQSQGRINVWDYYSGEEEEDIHADRTVMADSDIIFELSGETQGSSAASRRYVGAKEEQDNVLQLEEPAVKSVNEEVSATSVEFLMNRISEDRPLSMRTRKVVPPALPAAVDDTEPASTFEGFMNQLNLAFAEKNPSRNDIQDSGLLYATAVASRIGESHAVTLPRDKASHDVSRKGLDELGRHSKSQSEELGLGLNHRKSLREEVQRSMSTHPSLYECSIIPVPKDQSTGTSSPYSCVSCRNLGVMNLDVRGQVLEVDKLEAELDDLIRSNPQPDSGSTDVQQDATVEGLIDLWRQDQSQWSSVSAGADTSNASQFQPPKDMLCLSSKSSTVDQHRHDKDVTMISTAPVDELVKSDFEDSKQVETSGSVAGLGLQDVKTSEMDSPHPQGTKDSCLSILPPPGRLTPTRPLSSISSPAVVFLPTNTESDRSTLSPNKLTSARDATSTIPSFEAPEDSTISSLQQSTSNTMATSISTHASGFDRDHTHSELAAAKARGDSHAIQDSLQRSIKVVRHKYPAKSPTEEKNAPTKSSSLRLGKVRSNIMRFPSLPGSAKTVALGDFAASGDTLSVEKILKERVNIDSRSDNFKTPLMRAAMNGHIECMKLLKQYGADEVAVDATGRTALHIAVTNNRLAAVKWLLDSYPPPKPDPLKHRSSILFRATDVVKLGRPQKNLREASDAMGSRPLHIAAELDRGGMLKTLIAAGVDIESKDNWGRTPFHRAITSGRRDSFDTLIRSGAKIATVDAKSVSSLHLAAQFGQVDMIKTLLANGAERWNFDADGDQPIHSAVRGGNIFAVEELATGRADFDKRTKSGETLLHLACLNKDLEVAKFLLTKLVDVNPWAAPSSVVSQILSRTRIKGSSMTPLHYACSYHDFEMAVLLLDHEALVNAPTPEGATALMIAVETEDTNLVNLLLQREAKVNAKIPGSLNTALHLAARRGDLETVQQLCRHRADDRARASGSTYGRVPIEECAKCPDKKKGQAVEEYLGTIAINRRLANARKLRISRSESVQQYHNPSGAQIAPLADPVSYAPWARTQHEYLPDQGYVAQSAQTQNPQYYHPDFDVPDEVLPAYEPGPSAPARLANLAPVQRENYA